MTKEASCSTPPPQAWRRLYVGSVFMHFQRRMNRLKTNRTRMTTVPYQVVPSKIDYSLALYMLFPSRPPKWALFCLDWVKNGGDAWGFRELRSPTNEAESGMLRIRMRMWHLMFNENGWQFGESLLGQEYKRTQFCGSTKNIMGVSTQIRVSYKNICTPKYHSFLRLIHL